MKRKCPSCGQAKPLAEFVKGPKGQPCKPCHAARMRARRGPPKPRPSIAERFWSKVNKSGPVPIARPDLGPCWLWTGHRTTKGYGAFWLDGHKVQAHRFAYESAGLTIPAGLQADHLCMVRHCVRASHVEIVTPRVNNLRGNSVSARAARRETCPRAHSYSGNNLRIQPDGARRCRACEALRSQVRAKEPA